MEEEIINNEEKSKFEVMDDTMEKISIAMELTDEKEKEIAKKDAELHEESRPVVVEEKKAEIEKLKANKEEFDEMTINALVNMKKDILTERKEMEEKYQKGLLEFQYKKEELEHKLAKMKERADTDEKLQMVENSYNKALEQAGLDMKKLQDERNEKMTKLDEWEKDILDYALRLNAEKKLDAVTLATIEEEKRQQEELVEAEEKSEEQIETGKREEKHEPEEKSESSKREEKHAEQLGTSKREEKQSHQVANGYIPKIIKIKVNQKGAAVNFNGISYTVNNKEIKEIMELYNTDKKAFAEKVAFLAGYTQGESANLKEVLSKIAIKGGINPTVLDEIDPAMVAVANNIFYSKGVNADPQARKNAAEFMTRYLKTYSSKEADEKLHITYDLENLSKPAGIISRIKKQFFNLSEKMQIVEKANKAKEMGIVEKNGEFKPSFIDRIFAKIENWNKNKLSEKNPEKTDEQKAETIMREETAKSARDVSKIIEEKGIREEVRNEEAANATVVVSRKIAEQKETEQIETSKTKQQEEELQQ